MAAPRGVQFDGDVVRKHRDPAWLAVEVAKTRLAARVGEETGLFYVPRIVHFDAQAGDVAFERIPDLLTIEQLAKRRDPRLEEVVVRSGRALAAVHSRLRLDDPLRIEMSPEWMIPGADCAFLHSDFGPANVFLQEGTGRLVIIDWAAGPCLDRNATFGPRYFELAWSVLGLYIAVPAKCFGPRSARRQADAFLAAYLSQRSETLDADLFRRFQGPTWRLHFSGMGQRGRARTWYRKILYPPREFRNLAAFRLYRPGGTVPVGEGPTG